MNLAPVLRKNKLKQLKRKRNNLLSKGGIRWQRQKKERETEARTRNRQIDKEIEAEIGRRESHV